MGNVKILNNFHAILLFIGTIILFSCKTSKKNDLNGFIFNEEKSNLLLLEDFRSKGESLILTSPHRYNWKFFSYVTTSIKNDTVFLTNKQEQNIIQIEYVGFYPSKKGSITFIGDDSIIINNIPFSLCINDSILINSPNAYIPYPENHTIKNVSAYMSEFNLSFTDKRLISNDSIILRLTNSDQALFYNKVYSYRSYFIPPSNNDSSYTINFGDVFSNGRKINLTKKELKEYNIYKKFNAKQL